MSKIIDKNEDIYQDLTALGLDQNEASVYLSLLKLGEVGASKIVRDTGLHGQTVYDALYKLEEKNLIRFNLIKGRKKFLAQSPTILIDLIEKQKQVANNIAEKIEKRFSVLDFQDVENIKGKESFVLNEFKQLKETENGSELLVFGGLGDSYIKNMGNKINEYEYQRVEKEVGVRYIGSEKQKEYLLSSKNDRKKFSYSFLPDVFSGITNITVFKGKAVNIYLFDETMTVISIKNKKMAESYEGFFESLWGLGSK